ncbi:MAG: Gfo/Idh/MocA family oxidoreductase [Candidatus Omnitrophica bacterium]|nr:Gfo/Idh/MocA family oxidoreductase [Candidatus Omnitrophota bacterium]
MKKIRAGVVGVGSLGQHHVRILKSLPNVELVCICDTDKKAAQQLSELHKVPFITDYKEMTAHIDAVTIATPTFLHHEIGKHFLSHNIHALIEKPITLKLEDADELIALARERNLVMMVGHIERHNAAYRRVEKLANKVKFIEVHRLGPFTQRIKDCGVVLDLMIHDFDIILSLVNQEIAYLDAVGINVLSDHEDIANVRIKFTNGTIANITASRLTPDKQRKIRIFQEDAYLSLDYQNQEVKIYRKSLLGLKKEHLEIMKEEPLKAELENFVSSIIDGSRCGKPDIEARNALELALKCLNIIAQNNEVYRRNR